MRTGMVPRTEIKSMSFANQEDCQVLIVASEAVPFAKTGGLADVVGILPKRLKRMGCDVRVVLPCYQVIREAGVALEQVAVNLPVEISGENLPAQVFLARADEGVSYYLVKRDAFFDRPHLYGNEGGEYPDNDLRFTYFCKAVFSLCRAIRFFPDVMHCHEWQTALVPAFLRFLYGPGSGFEKTRSLLTIHNLAYQGVFPVDAFYRTGLPDSFFWPEGMEFWGKSNFLKAGILTSDLINTVSPTYSRELLDGEYGCGLEGVLASRASDFSGILNGADYEEWDPEHDPFLPARYSLGSMKGKETCKCALIEEMGLSPGAEEAPLFGMISRFASQKGMDLVLGIGQEMMEQGIHFVLLGEGDAGYQAGCEELLRRFPGRFSAYFGFDGSLAHRIQAGCDFLLMPSRYEPCGLNQIYSMRYGTVPVVRATGGLKDTVQPFGPGKEQGTGFLFDEFTPDALMEAVSKAAALYREGNEAWVRIRENCMKQCFSWDRSAEEYVRLYQKLRSLPPRREVGTAEKAL